LFRYIKKFFTSLNANAHPGDIAHAASLGLLLAFVPKTNLLWAFLFFLTMFIRVNKGAFFIALILLSFVVPFADVATEAIGFTVLSFKPLEPVFTAMYQTPFVGLTRFNNSMVIGGFVAGLLLYWPAYALALRFVSWYRAKLQPKLAKSKIVKVITHLPIIKQIISAPDLGGFRK